MLTLGLTGGIGMGKSTCAKLLAQRSIPVVDTDDLARQVVEPGQPALTEISNLFGPDILDSEGRLRRDQLARRVFADSAARRQLEAILHPRIRDLWRAQMEKWRSERQPLAVVVIPLLFETQAERELDLTLCVACSQATARQRLAARGWSLEQISQRIHAQLPVEQKMTKANYVIWSEGGMDVHEAQLDWVIRAIRKKNAAACEVGRSRPGKEA
jgi:dephospho-CoA kinase